MSDDTWPQRFITEVWINLASSMPTVRDGTVRISENDLAAAIDAALHTCPGAPDEFDQSRTDSASAQQAGAR